MYIRKYIYFYIHAYKIIPKAELIDRVRDERIYDAKYKNKNKLLNQIKFFTDIRKLIVILDIR